MLWNYEFRGKITADISARYNFHIILMREIREYDLQAVEVERKGPHKFCYNSTQTNLICAPKCVGAANI